MPKSCCNCKAETGALVYGVINAVITGILSIVFIILLTCVFIQEADHHREKRLLPYAPQTTLDIEMFILSVVTPIAVIGFSFAVLLIVGLKKKSPCLVMVYFIFGLLVTALSLFGIIMTYILHWFFVVSSLAVGILIIYALPLITVFMAYRNLVFATRHRPTYDHLKNPKGIEL